LKNSIKNVFSVFLTLILCISVFSVNNALIDIKAFAEDAPLYYEGKCGENIYWFFDDESGLLELKGEGAMYGYDVGSSPFYSCDDIKSAVIGSGITSLCDNIFSYCNELASVTVSGSVKTLNTGAFDGCSKLTEVNLPDTLINIENDAFYDCTALKYINIPKNVQTIGESAFEGAGIAEITIPSSVSVINKLTFSGCSALQSVAIPETVTRIDKSAFYGCNSLVSVFYGGNEDEWNAVNIAVRNDSLQNVRMYYYCNGMHAHTYAEEITVPVTCTSDGEMTYTCECGKTYTEVLKGGHVWSEWKYCSAENDSRTCTRCGETEYRERTTETENVFSLNVIEETDEYALLGVRFESGSFYGADFKVLRYNNAGVCEYVHETDYFYSFCNTVKKDNQMTASDSNCDGCKYSFASTAPFYSSEEYIVIYKILKNHDGAINNTDCIFKVTHCFDENEKEITCTVNNNLPEPENHVHSFTSEVTKRETCTENGTLTWTCECGDSYTEIIPAEHKYIHKKTAPSYSVDGFDYDVCIECYNVINYRVLPSFTKLVNEINGAEVDFEEGRIYGISPLSRNILDYLVPLSDSVTITAKTDVIGTGTKINICYDRTLLFSFDVIIFGDVNGDGQYDGVDALLVKLFSKGFLTPDKNQLTAADCNHDGSIDLSDVEILENAGVLLSEIEQSRTSDEPLESSTVYSEYVELIEQTDNNHEINNVKSDVKAYFCKIIELIKIIFSIFQSIFKINGGIL